MKHTYPVPANWRALCSLIFVALCQTYKFSSPTDRVYMFCSVKNTYLIIATLDVQRLLINRVKVRHVQCQKQRKQSPWPVPWTYIFILLIKYSTGLDYIFQNWVKHFLQHPWVATCQSPGRMSEPPGASRSTISFPFPNPRLKWYLFWKAELVLHLETFCSWIHKLCADWHLSGRRLNRRWGSQKLLRILFRAPEKSVISQ